MPPAQNAIGEDSEIEALGPSPCRHRLDWGDGIAASVLILNWNGKRFLEPCIRSVLRDACRHVEVVLVDNGSTDGSVQVAQKAFRRLVIISLAANLGYGAAYNATVREVSGRFVVFLNNDTEAESGWLAPLIDELIGDPQVALTTSKMRFLGTQVLNSAGGQLKLWMGGSELGFGRDEARLGELQVTSPFFASGAAMAISRKLFLELGGFDEHLTLYAEDLDISWRARLAGFTIRYVPQSIVSHHYSGTSGVFSPIKHRLGTTHYLAVMIKCLSTANLLHSLPAFTFFALAKGAGLAVVERDLAYFTNVLLSLRDTAHARGQLMSLRRETQKARVAPDRELLRSDGFGLIESPWALLRVLRQARLMNKRRLSASAGSES